MPRRKNEPHAVLAAYKFKVGTKLTKILALMREHAEVLEREGLRTPRTAWVLQSLADPTEIVEVFEWVDATAADRAHENAAVMELWGKFGALCDEIGLPPRKLAESRDHFAHFRSIAL